MPAFIEIKDLTYINEDGELILDSINAAFSSEEKIAVIGAGGSGKTTFLKLVIGLLKPTHGCVYLFGEDISKISRSKLEGLRSRVGFVFQDAMLISNLKVIENVMLPLYYHTEYGQDEIFKKSLALLQRVGYEEDIWALPGLLSLQTRKISAMARAMALKPDVMIYDKFFEEFDEIERKHMIRLINEFHTAKDGRLSIITFDRIDEMSDISFGRVLKIENKKLVE